jgi:3-oxoacyl-[acyl-carrier-protein] synthase-1
VLARAQVIQVLLAEVVGYAANSDGADMVAPSGEGATRCVLMALEEAKQHPSYDLS